MSEVFSIQIHNRKLFEQGEQGVWVELPTTTEKLQEAMRQVGLSTDNPQDFFINGYSSPEEKRLVLPYGMVLVADMDELNFLAARLEQLDDALTRPIEEFDSIGQIIDYPDNVDYFVHMPDIETLSALGDYYLHKSGMIQMPEEWKGGIDPHQLGSHIAIQEHGVFTEYGYLVKSGDDWQRVHEGQPVPEQYRVMAFPPPQAMNDTVQEAPAPEYIYQVRANPYKDGPENGYLLQAYLPQENGRAKMGDVLYTGTMEKCRELMGRLLSGELTQAQIKEQNENTPEPEQLTFTIYQLKRGEELRDYRFEPYERLQAANLTVDPANYEQVYTAPLETGMTLESIYEKFNIDHPADFRGHSLSVSDWWCFIRPEKTPRITVTASVFRTCRSSCRSDKRCRNRRPSTRSEIITCIFRRAKAVMTIPCTTQHSSRGTADSLITLF